MAGRRFFTADLIERLALRLRPPRRDELLGGLVPVAATDGDREPMPLLDTLLDRARLLDAVDLALHLDHRLYRELADLAMVAANRSVELSPSPSAYRGRAARPAARRRRLGLPGAHWSPTPVMLVRRVDPTAAAALEHARTIAPEPAGQLLGQAWRQVHRRDPDPTAGYATAVRAVEQVICPLMLPDDHTATSARSSRTCVRAGTSGGSFVLVDRDGTDTVALPASDRPRLSRRRDSIKGLTTTSTLAPLLDRLGEQRSAH